MKALSVVVVAATVLAALVVLAHGLAAVESQTHDELARLAERTQEDLARLAEAMPRQAIVELPEDGQAYYLTLVVHDDWQRRPLDRQVVAWFQAEPTLASARAQMHYAILPKSHATYQNPKWQRAAPTLPAVVITDAAGNVVLRATEPTLMEGPEKLGERIVNLWRAHPLRPWLRCDRDRRGDQQDADGAKPTPDTGGDLPDLKQDILPPAGDGPGADAVLVTVIICVLGGILAAIVGAAAPLVAHLQSAFRGE
jgi:hypothetical protein